MVTTSLALYTAFVVAIAIERLFELRLSKRNAAWAKARGAREVGARHFRVMSALHTLFLFSCVAEAWLSGRPFLPALGYPALAVALSAQALRYWAISTLGPRWNVRILVLPDAAPVTSGPYRFTRHPNYLAVVVELAAIPLVHSAFFTALAFSAANALVLYVRIRAEEAALGDAYQTAFAHKPRFHPGGFDGQRP